MIYQRKKTEDEQIVAWMQDTSGEAVLPVRLSDQYARMEVCDDLIRRYVRRSQVAKMLMKRYGYAKSAAYRDIADTQRIFGATHRVEKNYARGVLKEMMLKSHRRAMDKEDYAAVARIEANLMKLEGLDKEDPEIPDYSALQPVTVIVQFSPEQLGVQMPDDLDAQLAALKRRKRLRQNLNSLPETPYESDEGPAL